MLPASTGRSAFTAVGKGSWPQHRCTHSRMCAQPTWRPAAWPSQNSPPPWPQPHASGHRSPAARRAHQKQQKGHVGAAWRVCKKVGEWAGGRQRQQCGPAGGPASCRELRGGQRSWGSSSNQHKVQQSGPRGRAGLARQPPKQLVWATAQSAASFPGSCRGFSKTQGGERASHTPRRAGARRRR